MTPPAAPDEDTPTEAWAADAPVGRSSPASDGGRFVPGTVIGGRYRIVGLLGRGGMGQVYRADDLKLSHAVALKFLPPALLRDGAALARLHQEVRLARQIAHPAVCRVFDIGETEGEHFLTMEYIDGEDVASLTRRIGRLPADKALQVARQVCAGLAAAHEAGVLHRDLKPANVMIDGRGRARIADFGLAGLEADLRRGGDASGTPAYMAPEQLAGGAVTRQSEVYSLGLLLFELFTGRRYFDGATVPAVLRQRESGVSFDAGGDGLDPTVARVVRRCLEEDPARRPASVVQVAAALPGGDPLREAIAAGETPSPEMVAAAVTEGALAPRTAGLLLTTVVVLLALLSVGDRFNLHHRVPLEKPPEVLADRARTLLAAIGCEEGADRAFGFRMDQAYLAWDGDPRPPLERWRRLATGQPVTYYFWYRESPVALAPTTDLSPSETDPPAHVEGMARVAFDPRGRLVALEVVPPASRERTKAAPVDWAPLLAAAGLEANRLAPAEPQWSAPVDADEHVAWTTTVPGHPDLPARVEAAAAGGRPVFFSLAAPWAEAPLARPEGADSGQRGAALIGAALLLTVLAGGLGMARRNLRLGRGDRRGAFKVAATIFALVLASNLLGAEPAATLESVLLVLARALSRSLTLSAVTWVLYVALEPYVRRHRPELVVSWTRLLSGEWKDPMVGRDVLIGAALGLAATASLTLAGWLKQAFAAPQPPNRLIEVSTLDGLLPALGVLLRLPVTAIAFSFATLVFVALVRGFVRTEARAAVVLWAALWCAQVLATARSWPMAVAAGLWSAIAVATVTHFGLVAGTALQLVHALTALFPLTTDLAPFYAGRSLMAVGVVAALSIVAWRVSTAGAGRGLED